MITHWMLTWELPGWKGRSNKFLYCLNCLLWGVFFFLIITQEYVLIFFFRERGREGERERKTGRQTSMWETLIDCLLYVSCPRDQSQTFWCTWKYSNKLSHLARAVLRVLFLNCVVFLINFQLFLIYFQYKIDVLGSCHLSLNFV